MTDFKTYMYGIGDRVACFLLDVDLVECKTWEDFSRTSLHVCETPEGFAGVMARAEELFRQRDDDTDAVILATLFAMDYSGEAIKLADRRGVHFLGLMNRAGLSAREAVAACLLRLNR